MSSLKTGIAKFDHYVEGVLSGDIPVCSYIRQAIDRHCRDMSRQRTKDFPYYFDVDACMHYVNFFENKLKHFDGVFAGESVIFEPWQYFTFGSVFGWLNADKYKGMSIRRFREMIVIIPKKQGKSLTIAGTMIYMLDYDGYPGAQIYALATNQSHVTKLAYRDAEKLVENSAELSEIFRVNHGAAERGIYCDHNNSFIKPLSSKPKSTDGLKVHMSANDEVKDWDAHEIYDVIKDGTAANPNSLIANITTAGSDMTSVGYDRQEYLKRILDGSVIDEQTFGVIYTIDKEDREHWDDPEVIRKANPNYGVSVPASYYEKAVEESRDAERKKNDFLTKHLNVWINAMDHYYNMEAWNKTARKYSELSIDKFEGKPCYAFLDLAAKKDIAPLILIFDYGSNNDGKRRYAVFGHYFLPEDVVSQDLVGRRSEYNAWASMGYFDLTPGNTIDFAHIRQTVLEYNKRFPISWLGFDEWNGYQLEQELSSKRIKTVMIKQTTKYLSEPMKMLDSYLINKDKKGDHDPIIINNGDPVLTWSMGNVVAKEDAKENVFPRKEHRNSKIDPAVGVINLLAMMQERPLPRSNRRRRGPIVMKV